MIHQTNIVNNPSFTDSPGTVRTEYTYTPPLKVLIMFLIAVLVMFFILLFQVDRLTARVESLERRLSEQR